MRFNPIPKDAPEFFSDKAHYVKPKHTGNWEEDMSRMQRSRYYLFKIGRSEKLYPMQDKYIDDKAKTLLEQCRDNDERLVVKGYVSPPKTGTTVFVVLTRFGVYTRSGSSFNVYNPDTGEKGYYELKTE
jgi:hypothetical protein